MGFCTQQPSSAPPPMEAGSAHPKQRPPLSATITTANPLEQLASTFSVNDPEIPGYQSSWDHFSIDGASSIQSKGTLQSIVNGSFHCLRFPQGTLLSLDQNKLLHDIESSCCDPQHEHMLAVVSGANSSNSSTSVAAYSRKTRIRWTPDLHDKFIDCVNYLGGAERATPREILKLMGSTGLTILHVKSHLQKHRYAKFMTGSRQGKSMTSQSYRLICLVLRCKSDRKVSSIDIPKLCLKTSMQFKDILQLQLDLQRHLQEQLEIQKNLQQLIEEQGKQLKVMLEQQKQTK
ncbi:hypothetical protein SLEP1_g35194 [Rubroshorea leprosula]|uniref:HTH myb-type domain-containing protein n=1 Tax=Rubroshorea leprosula TaxID=152421 RepID=A0AAV5KMJ2_9ROSI|nr:hypothetical protein SLEP1_g35194 [Rubroshorea leprosula]